MVRTQLKHIRALAKRWHKPITVVGVLVVVAALVIAVAGDADEFGAAMSDAPLWILGIAALIQIIWLVARSEAWNVCVAAAGGTVGRTRLYRASSLGYLGGMFNGTFGLGVRIAALRRSAPKDSPHVSTLMAAELPIVVVEVMLAAIMSFTLIAPLGFPGGCRSSAALVMGAALYGLSVVARNRREGFWKGFAVLRGLEGRRRIVLLVILAVSAQVLRNWLVLQGGRPRRVGHGFGRAVDRDRRDRDPAVRPEHGFRLRGLDSRRGRGCCYGRGWCAADDQRWSWGVVLRGVGAGEQVLAACAGARVGAGAKRLGLRRSAIPLRLSGRKLTLRPDTPIAALHSPLVPRSARRRGGTGRLAGRKVTNEDFEQRPEHELAQLATRR